MLHLLAKAFIPRYDDPADPAVRRAYGTLCGAVGIALNLLLFAAKCIVGVVSGSVAIAADALNNLSDAGSSLVALLGFRLAGKKPDHDHPFGHGRLEYVSGLAVAGLILLMAVELAKSSVARILHPQSVTFTAVTAAVLVASIAIKLYMYAYNRSIGRRIQSAALLATAADSRSDALGTAVVLLSMALGRFTALPLDGWVGLAVAAAIFVTGVKAARETISPLLGRAPAPEFVAAIRDIVMAHQSIRGIHDLVVHDYGPGRVMITLHAEVPASGDMLALHDDIDLAERELAEQLGCVATIHMDPVVDDDATHALRAQVAQAAQAVDSRITIHDFRMVPGPSHTNLIFDAVVPYDEALPHGEVARRIREAVKALPGGPYHAVVTVETSYV